MDLRGCNDLAFIYLFAYCFNSIDFKYMLVSQQSSEALIFGLEALKPLMTPAEFALSMRTIGKHVKYISRPDAIRA